MIRMVTFNFSVAVLSLAEDCFGRNTGQPTALTHMYARRLQYEGFNVLLVNTIICILFTTVYFIWFYEK